MIRNLLGRNTYNNKNIILHNMQEKSDNCMLGT